MLIMCREDGFARSTISALCGILRHCHVFREIHGIGECKDRLHVLVEDFLVGGMQADKFFTYLLKKPSSAVIVGGDRTDIQLVGIENGVRCLILSGNLYPNEIIIARANAEGVPILVVRDDTYTVAKNVEGMAGAFSLEEREKIDRGIKLVDQTFDFDSLYKRLNFNHL